MKKWTVIIVGIALALILSATPMIFVPIYVELYKAILVIFVPIYVELYEAKLVLGSTMMWLETTSKIGWVLFSIGISILVTILIVVGLAKLKNSLNFNLKPKGPKGKYKSLF